MTLFVQFFAYDFPSLKKLTPFKKKQKEDADIPSSKSHMFKTLKSPHGHMIRRRDTGNKTPSRKEGHNCQPAPEILTCCTKDFRPSVRQTIIEDKECFFFFICLHCKISFYALSLLRNEICTEGFVFFLLLFRPETDTWMQVDCWCKEERLYKVDKRSDAM